MEGGWIKLMIKIGVVMGEVGKHGDKREKGGRRRRILMLSFFLERFWEKRAARKGFLLEIVILRDTTVGLVLGLGSRVQRGTFGAGWSVRPRQLAGWQDWFGLVEFQSLGRTFGCREKQGKTTNKDSNKGGPTSYLQVFSSRYVIVSTLANSV